MASKSLGMKKIFLLTVGISLICSSVLAQDYKDINKERQAMQKLTRSELNEKASRSARKAAKQYAKDGWIVAPGHLPLEKQLDRTYMMQYEFDDNLYPKYIMSEAMSIAASYDAAKVQALEFAKLNLAGQLQTQIAALSESTIGNEQLSQEHAASIAKSVTASKTAISQKLGRVIVVVECYRVLKNKNKEVRIQIAYNQQMAMQAAVDAVREDLEKQGLDLHTELDQLLKMAQ